MGKNLHFCWFNYRFWFFFLSRHFFYFFCERFFFLKKKNKFNKINNNKNKNKNKYKNKGSESFFILEPKTGNVLNEINFSEYLNVSGLVLTSEISYINSISSPQNFLIFSVSSSDKNFVVFFSFELKNGFPSNFVVVWSYQVSFRVVGQFNLFIDNNNEKKIIFSTLDNGVVCISS